MLELNKNHVCKYMHCRERERERDLYNMLEILTVWCEMQTMPLLEYLSWLFTAEIFFFYCSHSLYTLMHTHILTCRHTRHDVCAYTHACTHTPVCTQSHALMGKEPLAQRSFHSFMVLASLGLWMTDNTGMY